MAKKTTDRVPQVTKGTRKSVTATSPQSKVLNELKKMQRTMNAAHEQLGFVYGVLEELCERQELQAGWQLDFAKQLLGGRKNPSATRLPEPASFPSDDLIEFDEGLELREGAAKVSAAWGEERTATSDAIFEAVEDVLKDLSKKGLVRREKGYKFAERKRKRSKTRLAEEHDIPAIFVVPAKSEIH